MSQNIAIPNAKDVKHQTLPHAQGIQGAFTLGDLTPSRAYCLRRASEQYFVSVTEWDPDG